MLDGRSRRGPRPQRQDRNLRAQGQTLAAIADALNLDGVPTAQGGARWHPSTIRSVLGRVASIQYRDADWAETDVEAERDPQRVGPGTDRGGLDGQACDDGTESLRAMAT